MARFMVVFFDKNTDEVGHYITRTENDVDAICNHPWLTNIYRSEWVAQNIDAETAEECQVNLKEVLNWASTCVNLDTEIMSALNAGDSSVSTTTDQQN